MPAIRRDAQVPANHRAQLERPDESCEIPPDLSREKATAQRMKDPLILDRPDAREPRVAPRSDAPSPRSGAIVRRLYGIERLVALGNERYHACFNVVAALGFEGPATAALVQRALEHVQRQQACMRVEVVADPAEDGEWVFRETDERPRLTIVERTHSESWRDVWTQLAAMPIRGLAWCATWVRGDEESGGHIVVAFHHAISDARSVSLFFDALLLALQRLHERTRELIRGLPVTPPLHRLVGARWPVAAMARIGYHRYLGRLRTLPFDRATEVPVKERRWGGAFRALDPSSVQRLHQRCRAEGLTVGTVLSAATILELAARIRAHDGRRSRAFDVALCTSIDLRRFNDPPIHPRQMGTLVSAVHTFYRPKARHDVWHIAREVSSNLQRSIARGEHRDLSLLLSLLGPASAERLVRENQGRPADGALLVSNFGRLDNMEHGSFRATEMYFTGAQAAWGSTLTLCTATLRGTMYLHLGHPTPAIAEATGVSFLDGILSRLAVGSDAAT